MFGPGSAEVVTEDLKRPMKVRVANYPSHAKDPQIPARLVVDLVE